MQIYVLHELKSSIVLGEVEKNAADGGNFSAMITPLVSGPSLLHFMLNGSHIADSPYKIIIHPGMVRSFWPSHRPAEMMLRDLTPPPLRENFKSYLYISNSLVTVHTQI